MQLNNRRKDGFSPESVYRNEKAVEILKEERERLIESYGEDYEIDREIYDSLDNSIQYMYKALALLVSTIMVVLSVYLKVVITGG